MVRPRYAGDDAAEADLLVPVGGDLKVRGPGGPPLREELVREALH